MLSPAELREWLLASLSEPNVALMVMLLGVLAIYAELLLPGAVLPGSLGAVAALVGWYALSSHALHAVWGAAALAGIVLLLAEARWPAYGVMAGLGLLLLVLGLRFLLPQEPAIHWPAASLAGIIFGSATCFLARVAWRAYAHKQL